jgi:hypothetical protein
MHGAEMEVNRCDASNQIPPVRVPPDPLAGLEWNARRAEQLRAVRSLQRGRTSLALPALQHSPRATWAAICGHPKSGRN